VADLSDSTMIEALRRHMSMAAARQAVASSNLANVDTPGYKARELDFSDTLQRHVAGPVQLAATRSGHLTAGAGTQATGGEAGGFQTKEAAEAEARRDGNTVQTDRELLAMTRAAGEFARAQTTLAAKFRLLRYAINEGK
jgi:flagellar basal-body rod protein FlgB